MNREPQAGMKRWNAQVGQALALGVSGAHSCSNPFCLSFLPLPLILLLPLFPSLPAAFLFPLLLSPLSSSSPSRSPWHHFLLLSPFRPIPMPLLPLQVTTSLPPLPPPPHPAHWAQPWGWCLHLLQIAQAL